MANYGETFLDMQGKWVVVTGGSSGIGRAVAVQLAQCGARLLLVGRDEQALAETADLLDGAAREIVALDLSQTDAIHPALVQLSGRVGRIYGLCHAAGQVQTRPLSASKPDVVRSLMDVNLIAGLELARALCRRDVAEPDGGSVVFVSSVYGRVGAPGQSAYCATKGATAAAARALALELARRRIRVNVVSPGLVHTKMTAEAFSRLSQEQIAQLERTYPLGTGTCEDVARAVAFLMAPANGWITGIDMPVDGGYCAQ